MMNLNDITETQNKMYYPKCALVIYETQGFKKDAYVEHLDIDNFGNLINTHPLTVREANLLSKSLCTSKETEINYFQSSRILSANILYINTDRDNGFVIWYTKSQKRQMFFVENLEIPNGTAYVPPMIWKASKSELSVFAVQSNRRPQENTTLKSAPFFNIYADGKVCMGTVDIEIQNSMSLEQFIKAWEVYFFNSFFSHLLGIGSPIKGNCVTLWKNLIKTRQCFPLEVLKDNGRTLKNLIR